MDSPTGVVDGWVEIRRRDQLLGGGRLARPKVVPQRLVVDMRQLYREVEPTVYLGHYDRGWERDARGLKRDSHGYVAKEPYEVKLTPAEARQLGERLVHLADLADQNNPHSSPESA